MIVGKRIISIFILIIGQIIFIYGLSTAATFSGETGNLGSKASPDHIVLTWSADPKTTQTITWRGNTGAGDGSVFYRTDGETNESMQTAKVKIFSSISGDAPGSMNIYSVTLTGLLPGVKYIYRVKNGEKSSKEFSFTTESSNQTNFKFLVFGDSQSGDTGKPDYSLFENTIHRAYDQNKDAKFLINAGDLVETGQSFVHWNNWFDAASEVIDTIPEMPVQGNHETYNPVSAVTNAKPLYYEELFNVFENGPDGLKKQVYSYDYGSAHIVVLDSQEDEEAPLYGDILKAQSGWLDKDLSESKQLWKIVFFHKTPYYNKSLRANEALKAAFCPVIDKYHVDVVFNGHDHGISRTFPIKNDKYYSDPGNGTVYYVTGRSGAKYYNDLDKKVWAAFFYDPQDQPNYISVQIEGKKMTIRARKADGTIIDNYTIDKSDSSESTATLAPARYNITRIAVFGSLPGGQAINNPSAFTNSSGEWFIDIDPLMNYLGGSVSAGTNKNLILNVWGKSFEIQSDKAGTNRDKTIMVSAEALKTIGLNWFYNRDLNIIFFVK